MKDKLLATGIVGTVVAGVCCVTPVLVVFLGITLYAFARGRRP